MEILPANRQWMSRPADKRSVSLLDLQAPPTRQREISKGVVVSNKRIKFEPATGDEHKGMQVTGPNGHAYAPTHHSFGQLAQLAKAPAGYLRSLPAPVAADCLNYGMKFSRDVEELGILLRRDDDANVFELAAATGPNYGRIWNSEIADTLVQRFGDGVTGDWRVPGEFGRAVPVTKQNTTIYASDRDMFVFLADEVNRVDVPNRRDGRSGGMARGFFTWNSEVGDTSFGIGFFLFDYVCQNRIIWGADQYTEMRIRHTSGAPDRWLGEVTPILEDYSQASVKPILETIAAAKERKVESDMDAFLANRFGSKAMAKLIQG